MAEPQIPGEAPEKIDPKKELEAHRIRLHNLRHVIQLEEAVVKKLEELSR